MSTTDTSTTAVSTIYPLTGRVAVVTGARAESARPPPAPSPPAAG